MDMKPTDTDKTNNTAMTIDSTTPITPLLGPYNPNFNMTHPHKTKHNKTQTNNKKEYFPGPFSIQHLDEETRKGQTKPKTDSTTKTKSQKDNPLVDILSPFHLPASEIPEIHHENATVNNVSQHNILEPHFQVPIPDSKFEDDIPDTNEGVFAHFPFLSPPLTKPSKYDKDKSKSPGFPGLDGPKPHFPFHPSFNEEHGNKFPGLFKHSKLPENPNPNGNSSHFNSNSLSKPSQSDRERDEPIPFGPEGDHEFEYEGEPISNEQGHPLSPDQVYFIHNQGFPPQPQPNGKPNQDLYHLQHFQIPLDPTKSHQFDGPGSPTRYNKKKPIDKHHNQNEQLLPHEILTHLHSLPKGGHIPPHLRPEEILHYVQQNPQINGHHPPAHFLTPEEIYLYQNGDKLPNEGKDRHQPQSIPNKNTAQPGRDTIHIHSPNIPVSPSQRVEEILAHLRHQDPNQYPAQHPVQHFAPLPPHPHHPGGFQESLLTQHSSHAAVPLGALPTNDSRPGLLDSSLWQMESFTLVLRIAWFGMLIPWHLYRFSNK